MSKTPTVQSIVYFLIAAVTALVLARMQSGNITDYFPAVDSLKYSLKKGDAAKNFTPKNDPKTFTIKVHARFTPDLKAPYQQLFQTAKVNQGLRFEIDSSGVGALILGQGDGSYKVAVVTAELESGKEYDFSIAVYNDRTETRLNDVTNTYILQLDGIPSFEEVVVGNGYDMKRPFAGPITEFQIEADFFRVRQRHQIIWNVLKIGLFALGLVFGLLGCRKLFTP